MGKKDKKKKKKRGGRDDDDAEDGAGPAIVNEVSEGGLPARCIAPPCPACCPPHPRSSNAPLATG